MLPLATHLFMSLRFGWAFQFPTAVFSICHFELKGFSHRQRPPLCCPNAQTRPGDVHELPGTCASIDAIAAWFYASFHGTSKYGAPNHGMSKIHPHTHRSTEVHLRRRHLSLETRAFGDYEIWGISFSSAFDGFELATKPAGVSLMLDGCSTIIPE